jgi:hypothetical protein
MVKKHPLMCLCSRKYVIEKNHPSLYDWENTQGCLPCLLMTRPDKDSPSSHSAS